MNTPVTAQIENLLKVRGFEQYEKPHYLLADFSKANIGDSNLTKYYIPDKTVNVPTIADVVMWLYEKHGVWIGVRKYYRNGALLGFEALIDIEKGFVDAGKFDTPTEAYLEAIKCTLKYLI